MEKKCQQGHGDPKQGEHGADLAQKITCLIAVVPDFEIAVTQKSDTKLHHSYDAGTGNRP